MDEDLTDNEVFEEDFSETDSEDEEIEEYNDFNEDEDDEVI